MAVKQVPDGQHTVNPYLLVYGVPKLIEFMTRALGARELHRSAMPDGTIMHAQLGIGDSVVMMGEVRDPWKPMPGSMYLYVSDCDATYRRALDAGGESVMEPMDQFYGDRSCGVKDPVGNLWWIAQHKEDVSPEEQKRRMDAHMKR